MKHDYKSEGDFIIENGVLKEYLGTNPSVIIPENVRKIAPSGFSNCETLKSITIPNALTEIGYSAFSGCISLSEINYDGTKEQWKAVKKGKWWKNRIPAEAVHCTDGFVNLSQFSIKNGVLKNYFGTNPSPIIPKDVTKIGESAFSYSPIISINILEGVIEIGNESFKECYSLMSVRIPSSVTKIGEWVFGGCLSLSEIYYDGTKEQWEAVKKDFNWRRYIPAEFVQCTDGRIELPQFYIEDGVFYGYFGVNPSVIIPDSVVEIDDYAFYGCNFLSSINLPSSLAKIGEFSFEGCSSLESINFPVCITEIERGAFFRCKALTSISIAGSIKKMGEGAFKNCSSLSEVHYLGTKQQWKAVEKDSTWRQYTLVKSIQGIDGNRKFSKFDIKNGVLKNYLGLEQTIVIPNGITKIDKWAFNGSNLKSVTIPKGVTVIDEWAFSCSKLEYVNIPDSVTKIGNGAFYCCRCLKTIVIPDGVMEIGSGAFSECSSLVSISIPESVQKIGKGIFDGCTSLKENPLQSKLE